MTIPHQLLDALCDRDFIRFAACLDEDVTFRAVLPPRFLEAASATEVTDWFRRWFEKADGFEVLGRTTDTVAGRDLLTWRFRVRPHPSSGDPGWHVIEQLAFCDADGPAITRIDLLCSGFRPE